jgi:hypothetical protein
MPAPRLAAVIEVVPGSTGEVPVDVVRAAYCASRHGTVVLVLNGLSSAQVDRALDAVVGQATGVHGVVYCAPGGLDRVLRQAGPPRFASAWTSAVRADLARHGVPVFRQDAVLRRLDLLGRPVTRDGPVRRDRTLQPEVRPRPSS